MNQAQRAGWGALVMLGCLALGCVNRHPASVFRAPGNQDQETIFAPLDLPRADEQRRGSGAPGNDYWQQRCDYVINARLTPEDKRLTADMRVRYHNQSPHALDYLWVQLEQNLFRPDSRGSRSRPRSGSPMAALPDDFEGGYQIRDVRAGDTELTCDIDDTLMYIELPKPIQPGATFEFSLGFSFQMPPYLRRMGAQDVAAGQIFEYAQWFPHVCVYDDVHGWNTLNYLGTGEFYTNFGDYEVNITVPGSYLVGATGTLLNPEEVLTSEQQSRLAKAKTSDETVFIRGPDEVGDPASRPTGGERTWRFRAENVRTFAWAASDAFIWDACRARISDLDGSPRTVLCQSLYPAEAKVWGPDGEDGGSTQFVRHAVEFYSDFLYPYPYPQMTNVNGPEGGMEYPMIVFCGARTNPRGLFGVTDHEVGHNWFPMLVNTDERRHVWMDEGFNTFINRYSSEAFYGEDKRKRTAAANIVRIMVDDRQQPIVTYPDQIRGGRLGALGYAKTGAGLVLLREYVLGPERFDRAFRRYIRRWAFKSPRPSDFFRSMEDVAGEDLAWFWRGWFMQTGTLDQSVIEVNNVKADHALVVIGNLGDLVMPAEFEVTCHDGSTSRHRIPVEAFFTRNIARHRVDLGQRGIVTGVRLDPEGWLPDVEPANNAWGTPKQASGAAR